MGNKKKILIIEDNPYNREITELILIKEGYDTIVATDGEEALIKIEESPDLILLDLSLPKISGWEIIKKLRSNEKYNDLPVIALTAHAMVGDREKALQMGCSAYVSKPCLPADIVKEIKTFLK